MGIQKYVVYTTNEDAVVLRYDGDAVISKLQISRKEWDKLHPIVKEDVEVVDLERFVKKGARS